MSTLVITVVVAVPNAVDEADSQGFLVVVAADVLLVMEDVFLYGDSSSEDGLDLLPSVADADVAVEVEEVVSEILPKVEPVFQLGVCFFQDG